MGFSKGQAFQALKHNKTFENALAYLLGEQPQQFSQPPRNVQRNIPMAGHNRGGNKSTIFFFIFKYELNFVASLFCYFIILNSKRSLILINIWSHNRMKYGFVYVVFFF